MNNQEAVTLVKEAWIKLINEDLRELVLEEEGDEELSKYLIEKMKLKKKVMKCKDLQTIISLQREDCWDIEGSASFIIECLSSEEVEFGGGWST
jgi:hypothetical protein